MFEPSFQGENSSDATFKQFEDRKASLETLRRNSKALYGHKLSTISKPSMMNLLQKKPSIEEDGCSTISSNSDQNADLELK